MDLELPYLHLVHCPRCRGRLEESSQGLGCLECSQAFEVEKGVPRLYWPHQGVDTPQDVTERMRSFYEKNPFPDYDEFDSLASLMEKARKGVFARLLDEQIPFGARVLDCGCGTGQLSCFLGVAHRTVFGTDLSLSSLGLAQQFRGQHQLERVFFLQMNLFQPVFAESSFDVVICNGVLHHTADPYRGFQSLSRLVRPGGFLIVGLYHRWGRLATDLRRLVFRLSGPRWAWLDPRLRKASMSPAKKRAWFADQYRNPHESKSTIGAARKWLEGSDLEWVKSIPKTRLFSPFGGAEPLFEPEPPGNPLERGIIEFSQIWRGAAEGGFFTLIARKKMPSAS